MLRALYGGAIGLYFVTARRFSIPSAPRSFVRLFVFRILYFSVRRFILIPSPLVRYYSHYSAIPTAVAIQIEPVSVAVSRIWIPNSADQTRREKQNYKRYFCCCSEWPGQVINSAHLAGCFGHYDILRYPLLVYFRLFSFLFRLFLPLPIFLYRKTPAPTKRGGV